MRRSRSYTLSGILDGEDVIVVARLGPVEPPGTPEAGTCELEIVSVHAAVDDEDLSDHADSLDYNDLLEQALRLAEDDYQDAMERKADAQRDRF